MVLPHFAFPPVFVFGRVSEFEAQTGLKFSILGIDEAGLEFLILLPPGIIDKQHHHTWLYFILKTSLFVSLLLPRKLNTSSCIYWPFVLLILRIPCLIHVLISSLGC
jgi:hypothetical protein